MSTRLVIKAVLCVCGTLLSGTAAYAGRTEVEFITPSIVRVQWSADGKLPGNGTGICVYQRKKVKMRTRDSDKSRILTSSELIVSIDKGTGVITFKDRKDGRTLLQERSHSAEPVVQERIIYDDKSAHIEETANGKVTVKDIIRRDTIGTSTRYTADFSCTGTKALYGLGAHMEDYMNLLGKTMYLTQHNLKVSVPMLLSPQGYGVLFDAGCAMKFRSGSDCFTMQTEASRQLDYYFIKGERMDDIVASYRYLTGSVPLLLMYAFGYVQSKERYVSSDDILNTLREYRRRHVPIDMIVQDWNYWPEGWGYMKMDRRHYPDPKALADSVHAMNAKLMVSIWPNPQYCPEERDFRKRGFMLEHSVYDAFNAEARRHYWKYADEEFFSNGFDAWWCDSSEPLDGDWNGKGPEPVNGKRYGWDDHERRWHLNKDILSDALGAERSSLYSLYHSKGLYENQRAMTDRKRVVNLTRSSYAGQQRYSTIVWNGDTHASWASFRQQIPAGLNFMATGSSYWTIDAGSFFVRNDGRWFYKGEFKDGVRDDAYREYYTRMFQWATFLPMLRSHGTDTPREIWQFGEPGTPYYDAILRMINMRYQMIPYIYSMAAAQTLGDYSMARMLAFDYPDDDNVLDIKDEYMFGDILVCPVTHPLSESATRSMYLPQGNRWTDYWTGKVYDGGQRIEVTTSIDRLPLFVRCGSIIPTTAAAEHTGAITGQPITINVYPGADAEFTLYQDSGDGYDYEKGDYRLTRIIWDDSKKRLTVRKAKGGSQTFVTKVWGL